MVLGTFAETQVPRLQGRNPAFKKFLTDSLMKPKCEKEKSQPGFPITNVGNDGVVIGHTIIFSTIA
jgi:hypothetical protein